METVRFLHSRILWTSFVLFLVFLVVAWWIPNGPLMEISHSIRLAISLAVVVAYTPICLQAVKLRRIDRVHQLSLGIWMGWFSAFLMGVWSLAWRMSGKPAWMTESDLNAFFLAMSTMGATLHITAPGAIDGIIPRKNWIMLGIAFAAGALFATLVIGFQPSVAGAVDRIKPWVFTEEGLPPE